MHKTFPADKTANWCKKVKVCAQMLVHFCFGAKKNYSNDFLNWYMMYKAMTGK
jgi:hypothetical protein